MYMHPNWKKLKTIRYFLGMTSLELQSDIVRFDEDRETKNSQKHLVVGKRHDKGILAMRNSLPRPLLLILSDLSNLGLHYA